MRHITEICKWLVRLGLNNLNVNLSKYVTYKDFMKFFRSYEFVNIQSSLQRFGTVGDGGYLMPDVSEVIDKVYSFGVEKNSDFELDFAKRGVECILADFSVNGPAQPHNLFTFEKVFIDAYNSDEFVEINSFITKHMRTSDKKLLLKMDIEGCEYSSLLSLDRQLLSKTSVLIVEFHKFAENFQISNFDWFHSLFKKLSTDHVVVHVHQNNEFYGKKLHGYKIPETVEFTFMHKGLLKKFPHGKNEICCPHPLDCPSNPSKRDSVIDKIFTSDVK
jgi:hypothetical protein